MVYRSNNSTLSQVLSIIIYLITESDLKGILYLYQHAIEMILH